MKLLISAAILVASVASANAQFNNRSGGYGSSYGSPYRSYGTGSNPSSTYVQPRINSNGNYVGGHHRTTPNNTQYDNYGSRGNYNPYSGRTGSRSPRW